MAQFTLRRLFIFVTLCACGAWWITWPQRVADHATDLLNRRRFDALVPLMASESDRKFLQRYMRVTKNDPPEEVGSTSATPITRRWSQVVVGRQDFTLGPYFGIRMERGQVSFDAAQIYPGKVLGMGWIHEQMPDLKQGNRKHPLVPANLGVPVDSGRIVNGLCYSR